MPNEVELKLRIARKDAPQLRKHPVIAAVCVGKPVTRKLTSIYYDTPDLRLLDAGVSLRVRRMSGNWFQAVKAAGSSLAGLHNRMEWEDIIASGQPDFTRILDPELIKIFDDEELREALSPIFKTEVRRTEWHLVFDNGDEVELALDLGQLVAGRKREPIAEIELELKGGNTGRLFDLALALQQDIPLTLENVSKAQRGYAYYRHHPPAVFKARLPKLEHHASAAEAFKKIAWECINHLQGNQEMVLHGDDVEGVHQMRVALRRLRSAFSVFRQMLGRENCEPLAEELRWITGILGNARDLDVFITETLPPLTGRFDQHPGFSRLREKALAAQAKAYRELRTALHSQRYHRMLLTLASWIENERWRSDASDVPSVMEIADAMLAKRYKSLRKHGKHLMTMEPEERHQTRIAAKKLRYAAEFFVSLYPAGKTRGFIHKLAQVQDKLGVLNDIAVTEQLLERLAGTKQERTLADALLLFAGWNACYAEHCLNHMDEAWQEFAAQKTFW